MRLGLFDIASGVVVCSASNASAWIPFQGNTRLIAPTLLPISCLWLLTETLNFGVQTPLLCYSCFSAKETLESVSCLTHWQLIQSAYSLKSSQLPEKVLFCYDRLQILFQKSIQSATCYAQHSLGLCSLCSKLVELATLIPLIKVINHLRFGSSILLFKSFWIIILSTKFI